MRLLVRGQDIGWMTIGLSDAKGKIVHHVRVDCRPETILNSIMKQLALWKTPIASIESIAAVRGAGSFTAIRSSLTIVNTIGFARQIPLAAIVAKPHDPDTVVLKRLAKARGKRGTWINPHYGSPPLITKAKKKP